MEPYRQVTLITMKRKYIRLWREADDDKYGHWWFEIGVAADEDSESYGWWPKRPVSKQGTFVGVAGELNGQSSFSGTQTRDPNHGDDAEEEFHPWVQSSDQRRDVEIAECLRRFAVAYNGEWRWAYGAGQNCRTFQDEALRHCRLRKRPPKVWF